MWALRSPSCGQSLLLNSDSTWRPYLSWVVMSERRGWPEAAMGEGR